MHLHHPLLVEFAQHSELIRKLREENVAFRQLAEQYHAIDRRVCRIERAFEVATDQETETLKKARLHLKDQLYHEILKAAQPA
jgi:uncharacterized protein YdcH (DUF465 family)